MAKRPLKAALDSAKQHLEGETENQAAQVDGETADAAGKHEAEHNAAIERLIQIANDAEFDSGTLLGDIRDTMLQLYKDRPKPWSQLSNQEQRDVARNLDMVAKEIIRKVVLIVAEGEQESIHATLESYSEKDGFKISLKALATKETAIALFEATGSPVIVQRADYRQYHGQRKDAETMPDQPDLGFADPPKEEAEEGKKPVAEQAREDFAADSAAEEAAAKKARPLTPEEEELARATPVED